MSRSLVNPSLKRKRPETQPPGVVDAERAILDLIKSKKDMGIWIKDIKSEIKLPDSIYNKVFKSLIGQRLIKEVVNIHNKGKKHYMAVEFQPSKDISGGDWYNDGELDRNLIHVLKQVCFRYVSAQKVATVEGVHNEVKKRRVVTFDISAHQIGEILNSMVLDNDIIEVKSTGMGDYYSIPIGSTCYRVAGGAGGAKAPKMRALASTPCGACPRISLCTSDGVISPSTCVYYDKWLDIEF